MKTHLNTLFVATEGSYLAKDGRAVAVRFEKQTKLRVPLHNLDGIVCLGRIGASPALLAAAAEAGVRVSFLSARGRFLAAVQGYTPGNVLLRREQYRAADDEARTLAIARSFVLGKLANCRTVLLRAARESTDAERSQRLCKAADRLAIGLTEAKTVDSLDALRGLEGEAGARYFGAFDDLLGSPDEAFRFNGRSRRPPLDRVNALLSFVYTLLMHDLRSACESVGLDAAVGFLHRDRPGRPGLALDMMEEFRPVLADRLVLSLINRGQVAASGFETLESGGVVMNDATRKAVIVAWQKRKQEEAVHPFLDEKTTLGLWPHLQARLLARHLRRDLDAYPPVIWK
ncbi:MAG: type I-C CRISPR-associated endonuclease Cas1 [Planctomycetaceae bacterium]|nr:type I-C CRISPR-associated endonuclease Cas1 [Planctomycetaceae bacterium]